MTENPPPPGNFPPSGGEGLPPEGGVVPPAPPSGYPPPPPGGAYPPPPPGGYPPPPPPAGAYPPPGGYPPPPPGGYPPPPPGGYPPPPLPGGAYPPPPPPQGGYAPAPPGGFAPPGYGYGGAPGFEGQGFAAPFNVGDALSWAWNKFTKNAVPLIVATLVYALIIGALEAVMGFSVGALGSSSTTAYESSDGNFVFSTTANSLTSGSIAVLVIGYLVILLVAGAISSAYYGGLLGIANGQPTDVGSFFKPRHVGSVILIAIIVGFVTGVVGFVLGLVPFIGPLLGALAGLVIGVFVMFATVACIDRTLPPIDAIKVSIDIAKANFGQVLLIWLLSILLVLVGVLLCLVGLLVTAPVVGLLFVYTYRRLSGGLVAPLTP